MLMGHTKHQIVITNALLLLQVMVATPQVIVFQLQVVIIQQVIAIALVLNLHTDVTVQESVPQCRMVHIMYQIAIVNALSHLSNQTIKTCKLR
jgi:hypothetical protein